MKFLTLLFSFSFLFFHEGFAGNPPLVLQYEVSHSRNLDQISLIFRRDSVELVVNTSSWQFDSSYRQNDKNPRLGRFESRLTPRLLVFKMQAQLAYESLSQSVPLASLLDLPPHSPDSHAPVLFLGGREIEESSPYFVPLARIIYRVWESANWNCLECAIYKKRRNKIVRTVKRVSESKKSPQIEKKVFSEKELSCRESEYSVRIECMDPDFGTFEI